MSKSSKWLASAIGQGVVGWAVIKLGGYVVGLIIAFFFALFAYDSGLSWYWLIFLSAAVLFFLVNVVNGIVGFIIRISNRKKEGAQLLTKDKAPAPTTVQEPEPKVLIVTPVDNEGVGLRHRVRGYVFPPHSSLQVLVYSGDDRWYVQPDVDVDGYIWSVECQFGNAESKDGSPYKLMAVYGDGLIERRYKALPDGLIESNEVRVHRAAESTASAVIVTPIQNEGVGYRHMVRGSVTPAGTPVQVLISHGRLWWRQQKVDVSGSTWNVECTFGDEDKLDTSHSIIAVVGDQLKDETYEVPPYNEAVTSDVVSVQRRPPDTQLCPNQQLHKIAESDRANIGERLTLIGVDCVTHFGDVPYIDFVFWVFNLALVSVSIDDALSGDGRITFHKDRQSDRWKFFRPPTLDNNLAKGCFFRGKHRFTIRQEMSHEEAALVERSPDDSFFYFGDLRITMHGEGFSGVPFRIGSTVEKKTGLWADAFGDTDSHAANKLAEVERQHNTEMQRLKNRLPAVMTLCSVHGAGLHLRDELLNNRLAEPRQSMEAWWSGLRASISVHVGDAAMDRFCEASSTIPDSTEEMRTWITEQLDKLAALTKAQWPNEQNRNGV